MEEFGPKFLYIKGTSNIVADSLSRLEKIPASSAEGLDGSARKHIEKSERMFRSFSNPNSSENGQFGPKDL